MAGRGRRCCPVPSYQEPSPAQGHPPATCLPFGIFAPLVARNDVVKQVLTVWIPTPITMLCREDDTACIATEQASWRRSAADAEAAAVALRQELLAAALKTAAAEKERCEYLPASLWPLAARVKALEAAEAMPGTGTEVLAEGGSL